MTTSDTIHQHAPMHVRRVHEGGSSHIEPELDPGWSELEKLRWRTGVLKADTGIEMRITTGGGERPFLYGYTFGHKGGGGSMVFVTMWTFINGVDRGYRMAQR